MLKGHAEELLGQTLESLRADLAAARAQLAFDRTIDREDALRRELAETRQELEGVGASRFDAEVALESTRAELAKSEARVKAAIETLEETRWMPSGEQTAWVATREGQNHSHVMRALEVLRV